MQNKEKPRQNGRATGEKEGLIEAWDGNSICMHCTLYYRVYQPDSSYSLLFKDPRTPLVLFIGALCRRYVSPSICLSCSSVTFPVFLIRTSEPPISRNVDSLYMFELALLRGLRLSMWLLWLLFSCSEANLYVRTCLDSYVPKGITTKWETEKWHAELACGGFEYTKKETKYECKHIHALTLSTHTPAQIYTDTESCWLE